jgi:hypothetical protein
MWLELTIQTGDPYTSIETSSLGFLLCVTYGTCTYARSTKPVHLSYVWGAAHVPSQAQPGKAIKRIR